METFALKDLLVDFRGFTNHGFECTFWGDSIDMAQGLLKGSPQGESHRDDLNKALAHCGCLAGLDQL